MKTNPFLAIIFLLALISVRISAQDAPWQQGLEPVSLTPEELFVLSNIPELKLPARYLGDDAPLLPFSVDNSQHPYFRPITQQSGYECGQSAGISFNFCYEIDRLRQLPANVANNQYPSHFTWNFLNEANNYMGVSFFDSWEIVRACGNMNVTDYGGGLNTGGYTRWISGYDAYYNGMKNRINSVKAIRVDTPEGLQTLKYWLFDHLEGSAVGGVANIYAQYFSTPCPTLPTGTPESGKFVQNNWGGSPSHAWTICGYNDSIRYDFNGDGQFTNNIDINNDGVVNMKDWEIGGLKFANGYAGTGWGNSGFCYTMYKNLADNIGFGGIWNHTVYVLDVKATCDPKFTMKVTLKHTCRNKLKVTVGVNPDISATIPLYIHEYPIFNYQGGSLYMQGGTSEVHKTIEFGLDITPLVNQITTNQAARYFLQVNENDPAGTDAGEIVSWALIDHTLPTPVIQNYPTSNVPLQNNGLTRLYQNYTLFVNKPAITTATLPPAQIYQPYSATLSASGGTPPYQWDVKLDYPETTSTATFPAVTAQQLTLTSNSSGYVVKNLDFDFPFYKKMIDKVYVYADGYILFDDQPYTWPYLVDKTLLFRQTRIIAPFLCDQTIYPSSQQGVWYEGNGSYAIFRWKASLTGMQGSTVLNYAVKLYPNGTIEYYYGDMTFPAGTQWTGGLSHGDNKNFQYSTYSNAPSIALNTLDKFNSCGFPPEMEISEDGIFSGTPVHSYQNLPIKFIVTDNDNLTSTRTLLFSSFGLLIGQTVVSGNDSLIEFGETAHISLSLNNIGTQTFNQISFRISSGDPFITITDSLESLNTITGGQSMTLDNAFTFLVSSQIPDGHAFTINLQVQSQGQGFNRPLDLMAHAPIFEVLETRLNDGDNEMLDAGETADLLITYRNSGSAKASEVNLTPASNDPSFSVNSGLLPVGLFEPGASVTLPVSITGSPAAPFEHIFPLQTLITANNGIHIQDTVFLFTGRITEDFETGDFSRFPWLHGGQWPWFMEQGVKYEGSFAIRSGVIEDSQESKLSILVNVLAPGPVSFYKYVSCEQDPSGNHTYDYLTFFIDGHEMGRWDGVIPWSKESFWLAEGHHVLSWVYHKDYTVAAGWDGCLIDFITFPLIEGALPELVVNPLSLNATLQPGASTMKSLAVSNIGGGLLDYSVIVFDTAAGKKDGNTDNLEGSSMTCNESQFAPGQAFNWQLMVINKSSDNENLNHIKVDCPPGMNILTATNFSGGTLGELVFSGSPGSAPSLNWHGETSGGGGLIKPGDTAYANINGTIDGDCMMDLFLVYDLRGDSTGASSHHLAGFMKVENNGISNTWLSVPDGSGSLPAQSTDSVVVNFDATGLVSGYYTCQLIVRDPFNNQVRVPVGLLVPFPVGEGDVGHVQKMFSRCVPNPFSDHTSVQYYLQEPGKVLCKIRTSDGRHVKTLQVAQPFSGKGDLMWDGTDQRGKMLPSGLYIGQLESGGIRESFKIIILR